MLIIIIFMYSIPLVYPFRKLSVEQAPDCSGVDCQANIFHVRAEGSNDTLHYLWDFTEKPTFLLVKTSMNSNVKINWTNFNKNGNGCVSFTKTPEYSLTVVFDKLIIFDDVDDLGVLSNNNTNSTYDMRHFFWTSILVSSKENFVSFNIAGNNHSSSNLTGSLIVTLDAFGFSDHSKELPRLLHSDNSSQVSIVLRNLQDSSLDFKNVRWAFSLLVITTDYKNESLNVNDQRSWDDEYSPGVFKLVDLVTPRAQFDKGANLQWRPVVYTSLNTSISNSSDVKITYPINEAQSVVSETLVTKVDFLFESLDNILIQSVIVSFGSPKDGFYKKTNYSSWSFLINFGSPQYQEVSMMVILIMAIGLGVPALLIALGGLLICVRRFTKGKDDFSLGR